MDKAVDPSGKHRQDAGDKSKGDLSVTTTTTLVGHICTLCVARQAGSGGSAAPATVVAHYTPMCDLHATKLAAVHVMILADMGITVDYSLNPTVLPVTPTALCTLCLADDDTATPAGQASLTPGAPVVTACPAHQHALGLMLTRYIDEAMDGG